jgi:hypothetical protein
VEIPYFGARFDFVPSGGQSPKDPLVSGDRVFCTFLDNKTTELVVLGRFDRQDDVFATKQSPTFSGTVSGDALSFSSATVSGTVDATTVDVAGTVYATTVNASSHTGSTVNVTGIVTCASVTETSDERAKTRIKPLTGALEKIKQLVGVTYKSKTPVGAVAEFPTMDGSRYGIIAQDSAKIVPSAVTYDAEQDQVNANGWARAYGVDYGSLVAVLIEAVKELSEQVEELKSGQNETPL